MIETLETFITLLLVCAVTDVALQTEWMGYVKGRYHMTVVDEFPWYYAMGAHAAVNGAGVWFVTRSPWLGLTELGIHFITDHMKTKNRISIHQDVAIHIISRAVYAVVWGFCG